MTPWRVLRTPRTPSDETPSRDSHSSVGLRRPSVKNPNDNEGFVTDFLAETYKLSAFGGVQGRSLETKGEKFRSPLSRFFLGI